MTTRDEEKDLANERQGPGNINPFPKRKESPDSRSHGMIKQNKVHQSSLLTKTLEGLSLYKKEQFQSSHNVLAFFSNFGLSFLIRALSILCLSPTSSSRSTSPVSYLESIHHNGLEVS